MNFNLATINTPTGQLILHIIQLKVEIFKKKSKNIFGSELSETINEPNFRLHRKNWQKIDIKNQKIIFDSDLSETINESTFRLHQKNWQKIEENIRKIIFGLD